MECLVASGHASRSCEDVLYNSIHECCKRKNVQGITGLAVGRIGKTSIPDASPLRSSDATIDRPLGGHLKSTGTMGKFRQCKEGVSKSVAAAHGKNKDNAGKHMREQLRAKGRDVLDTLGQHRTRNTGRMSSSARMSDGSQEVPAWLVPRTSTPTYYAKFKSAVLDQRSKEHPIIPATDGPSKTPMKIPVTLRSYDPEHVFLQDSLTMPFLTVPDTIPLRAELAW
eukprot:TRINITY_DN71143_c0_g1_i1.p1 TRINITY_DN71143_c0_g1~~TRINITY_DN71143_c0_g1_i1.p1  ORF type:complete len:225 (+),score=38.08 TRINITY_DN71143_c0_g1_i1:130-804(+)